jgi:hypothetical protein
VRGRGEVLTISSSPVQSLQASAVMHVPSQGISPFVTRQAGDPCSGSSQASTRHSSVHSGVNSGIRQDGWAHDMAVGLEGAPKWYSLSRELYVHAVGVPECACSDRHRLCLARLQAHRLSRTLGCSSHPSALPPLQLTPLQHRVQGWKRSGRPRSRMAPVCRST